MSKNYETFGNYILLEKLAAGGMAEVYLAKKLAASGVQKFVAIKRILSQFSDSKDFIQMFKDEAKIAINLSHSNIVSIFDFGIQSNQFYIVMEFVEGRNLRQILNRMKKVGKRFSTAQIVQIMAQTASGLEHAHRCIDPTTGQPLNIIHRDMSPQNVMLTFEAEAKIVDFGIAKAETQAEATRAGTLKGKFGYMSPEQVEGQIIDSRTDIFALGIMMWEMLAGQRLFLSSSELNTLRNIRECNVTSLREINPNIPIELDQIVQKALKKDKSERYQTCAELSRDLSGFLNRFEPDFSSQDFSIFIKGMYSEEIVETRKKQIMFAQVNVAAGHQEYAEKTVLMTQTESEVVSDITFEDMSLNTVTKSQVNHIHTQGNLAIKQTQPGFQRNSAGSTGISKITQRPFNTQVSQITRVPKHLRRRKSSFMGAFIPILLFLSLTLGAIAYLIHDEPELKAEICDLLSDYNICVGMRTPDSVSKQKHFLEIITQPPGANVYINGKKKGRSPLTIDPLVTPFRVSARYIGYRASHQDVNVVPKSKKLDFKLERIPTGFLKIHVTGADIFVNGLKVEKNIQTNVPASEPVDIRLYNPINGVSKNYSVEVPKGETKNLFYTPPTTGN